MPDLIYWTTADPPAAPAAGAAAGAGRASRKRKQTSHPVELHLIQVKVGKKGLYVSAAELANLLGEYPHGAQYNAFLTSFLTQLTTSAPDHLVMEVQLHPRFVTSRHLSAAMTRSLQAKKFTVMEQQYAAHQWGARVENYCKVASLQLFS